MNPPSDQTTTSSSPSVEDATKKLAAIAEASKTAAHSAAKTASNKVDEVKGSIASKAAVLGQQAQGIADSRLITIGYGSDKPIGDNKTNKGREPNRRIEFRLLSDNEGAPAGVTGGMAPAAPAGPPAAGTKAPELRLPPAGEPMPAK